MSETASPNFEPLPDSTFVRAQARQQVAAECAAIRDKARQQLELLKASQAAELAREQARARSSLRRFRVATCAATALALASALVAPELLVRPSLGKDGEAALVREPVDVQAPTLRTTARAVREKGPGPERAATPDREPGNETVVDNPTACSEWDPLAFCLRR